MAKFLKINEPNGSSAVNINKIIAMSFTKNGENKENNQLQIFFSDNKAAMEIKGVDAEAIYNKILEMGSSGER